MNEATISESSFGNLKSLGTAINSTIRCVTFAVVTRVWNNGNASTSEEGLRWKYTLDARPIVKEGRRICTNGKEGTQMEQLPTIINIPYIRSWVPAVNDYCILLHLDRSISNLDTTVTGTDRARYTIDSIGNMHNIGDCVAIGAFL